jgi:hypothetical protein
MSNRANEALKFIFNFHCAPGNSNYLHEMGASFSV